MRSIRAAASAAILAGLLWPALVGAQTPLGLEARLAGAESGDPDGMGTFTAEVDREAGRVCYELAATRIGQATAAHIHRGAAGESGRPVVGLDAPTDGTSSGCESVAPDLLAEIAANPGAFYVNVHNAEFRGGAIRGQLMSG